MMSKFIRKLLRICLFAIFVTGVGAGYTHFATTFTETTSTAVSVKPKEAVFGGAGSSASNVVQTHKDSGLATEVQALRNQLSDQQQQNLRQAEEIQRLNALLAQREPIEDWSCDDDSFADELSNQERERENQLIAQRADGYERALVTQRIDYDEGDELLVEVGNFLKADSLNASTLMDSRCGETFCRVELHHSTEHAFEEFVRVSPMLFEQRGESLIQVIENADGSSTTVLFLSKDGSSLPQVES